MICIVQRVSSARVIVAGSTIGAIKGSMAVLACVHATDTVADVEWTVDKLATLRIFRNGEKHFDLDVLAAGGAALLVSNFTVAADTRKGRRPSFEQAAKPEQGRLLFDALVRFLRGKGLHVETGQFGADMSVEIVNDGPATFTVDSRERTRRA